MKLFNDVGVLIDHVLDDNFNKIVKVTVTPESKESFILTYPVAEISMKKLESDVRNRLGI